VLVKSSRGHLTLAAPGSTNRREFFRDVIREGYLSKLPPARNRLQAWKKRYFKLVIALSRSLAGGPVFLEYYTDHNKKHAKVCGVCWVFCKVLKLTLLPPPGSH